MEYGEEYFEHQKPIGEFGAYADFFKIEDILNDDVQSVLEFGCGGGFWLARIKARRVLGVETNPVAREHCKKLGVPVVADLHEVGDEAFDLCFSHHALEHVRNPFDVLAKIRTKLRPKGLLRLITPFDDFTDFNALDPNHHLYTWSVQNLGNLLTDAGYRVTEAYYLYHTWPSNYQSEYEKGAGRFHRKAVKTAKKHSIRQVIATALKE